MFYKYGSSGDVLNVPHNGASSSVHYRLTMYSYIYLLHEYTHTPHAHLATYSLSHIYIQHMCL